MTGWRQTPDCSKYIEEKKILEREIEEICSILWYQCGLKEQDRWLKRMIEEGILSPITDEE